MITIIITVMYKMTPFSLNLSLCTITDFDLEKKQILTIFHDQIFIENNLNNIRSISNYMITCLKNFNFLSPCFEFASIEKKTSNESKHFKWK